MSTSNSIFSGNSRYSTDFQSVIDRAVAIASLPMNQLSAQKTTLSDESVAISGLGSSFSSLLTAIQQVDKSTGLASLKATVADSSLASVTLSNGAMAGDYALEIKSLGANASSMSKAAWAGGTTPFTYQLQIGSGGDPIDITAATNDASAVAAEINAKAGDQVRATVINIGGNANPDYRLMLQSVKLGADTTPQLLLNGVDMQQEKTAGAPAQYVVGGSGNTVSSDTRTVSIAPGVSVNLLATNSGSSTTVSVTSSSSTLQNALQAFASTYNSVVDELDRQQGTSGGALAGQSLVKTLSSSLRSLATYDSNGMALADIGFDLGTDGHLTFNSTTFQSAYTASPSSVTSFLGSATGGGFLKLADATLDSINDPTAGTLTAAKTANTNETSQLLERIDQQQTYVDTLKERLNAQMAAADAAIASMEQQYSYIYNLFQSMQNSNSNQ
jgi:flagellar hook-associated protein 2